MKRTKLYSLIAITPMLFMNIGLFGQNAEEGLSNFKVFGMGMHIEQFKLTDITMDISTAPANKIIFTITPTNNFRLEPEIGFNYLNDKESDLKSKSIIFGLGGFGMFQRGRTNFYSGLKFEYANISDEYEDSMGDKQAEKTNRLSVGPAIGAEYFFGSHFSFGGEIGFKYMILKTKESRYSGDEINQTYITTDSGLILRFYF